MGTVQNQDTTSGASPTIDGANVTGIPSTGIAGKVVPVSRYLLAADSQLTGDGMGATTETAHTALTLTSADVNEARRVINFRATWFCDSDNGADTWTLKVRVGGVAGQLIHTVAAFDCVANQQVVIEGSIQIRSTGAGGTFDARAYSFNEVGSANENTLTEALSIDTTGTVDLVVTSESSSANAAQQGTLRHFEAQVLDA